MMLGLFDLLCLFLFVGVVLLWWVYCGCFKICMFLVAFCWLFVFSGCLVWVCGGCSGCFSVCVCFVYVYLVLFLTYFGVYLL